MTKKGIPTVQERRKRNHEQMIDDILQIAREMMQADGVAALSFNAIARRLGMKPPSLYTYFDGKHAIYDALFRLGYERFARHMEAHTPRDQGVDSFLRTMTAAYMQFALENPDLYQLMFQRPVPGFEPSEASMAVSTGHLQRFRQELQTVLAEADIHLTTSIEESGDLLIAMMHGLTELQLANNPESPVGAGRYGSLVEHAVEVFLIAWKQQ